MLRRIYLGAGTFVLVLFGMSQVLGWEWGSTRLGPPPLRAAGRAPGGGGGGGWFWPIK